MSVDRAQIEHLRSFVATPRCMSYETIRSLGDILDNLEAASAEVAALRRQVEELREIELSEECQGGIVVGCTWHDGPPHQWHANDGSRAAIAHLLSERDRLASELQAVRGELATARDALRGIWPFIEEDDGGFATPAYQKAINDVRAALAMTEGANP